MNLSNKEIRIKDNKPVQLKTANLHCFFNLVIVLKINYLNYSLTPSF